MVLGGRSSTHMVEDSLASFTADLLDPRRPCLDDLPFPFKTAGGVGAFLGGIMIF